MWRYSARSTCCPCSFSAALANVTRRGMRCCADGSAWDAPSLRVALTAVHGRAYDDDDHDLSQPELRNVPQCAGDDPAERRGACRHRVFEESADARAPESIDRRDGDSGPGALAREGNALCRTWTRRSEMDRRRA